MNKAWTPRAIAIFDKLLKTDLIKADVADVAAIIGDSSWVSLNCAQCQTRMLEIVMAMGTAQPNVYNHYCIKCMKQATHRFMKELGEVDSD